MPDLKSLRHFSFAKSNFFKWDVWVLFSICHDQRWSHLFCLIVLHRRCNLQFPICANVSLVEFLVHFSDLLEPDFILFWLRIHFFISLGQHFTVQHYGWVVHKIAELAWQVLLLVFVIWFVYLQEWLGQVQLNAFLSKEVLRHTYFFTLPSKHVWHWFKFKRYPGNLVDFWVMWRHHFKSGFLEFISG